MAANKNNAYDTTLRDFEAQWKQLKVAYKNAHAGEFLHYANVINQESDYGFWSMHVIFKGKPSDIQWIRRYWRKNFHATCVRSDHKNTLRYFAKNICQSGHVEIGQSLAPPSAKKDEWINPLDEMWKRNTKV